MGGKVVGRRLFWTVMMYLAYHLGADSVTAHRGH
jgi:hypothetical protein